MKQVWVNAATCSRTAVTTRGAALPTLTTAIPAPRSMKELPSTSTITPPPARSTNTGSVVPTPADTVAARRAINSRERGPGTSVTSRRSWTGDAVSASRSVTESSSVGVATCIESRVRRRRRVWSRSARRARPDVRFGTDRPRPGSPVPVTIGDLLGQPGLDLRLLTADAPVDRPLSWVHVSELADPGPFLQGGELLLTTGLALRDEEPPGPYVRRLVDAGIAALGFGTGLGQDAVLGQLVEAADEAGLPVVEVPRGTPFIALSRSVSTALAAEEYAAVTRSLTVQQELTRAALAPGRPAPLLQRLARAIGGWAVLLDTVGAPLEA